jgi:hypothetical protein
MSKKSTHACMNNNCSKYAFICDDEECSCQEEHPKCFVTKNSKFIKAIEGKIVSIQLFEDSINKTVDQMIDGLSEFRDKIIT